MFEEVLLRDYSYDAEKGLLYRKGTLVKITPDKLGYARLGVYWCGNRKTFLYHRVCWFLYYGAWPKEIDHIDRNTLNNKINNLREVTSSVNLKNRNPLGWSSSGYKGVSKHRNRWLARVNKDYVGYYNCPTVAYFNILKVKPKEEGF